MFKLMLLVLAALFAVVVAKPQILLNGYSGYYAAPAYVGAYSAPLTYSYSYPYAYSYSYPYAYYK